MKKKIVIIGGVAGGASAAARLRRLDEHAEIVMIERGEHISFANCGLPYYIGGKIRDRAELTLQTPESFHARFRVDVRVCSEALSIDRRRKTVTVKNLLTGETYEEGYDKLILSTGAEPIVPKSKGIQASRVFTLRSIPDTDRIKSFIEREHPRTAAIIGGGYIGLEMAENLMRLGISVSIVELSKQILAPFDGDMTASIHRYLRRKGVNLYLGNGLQEIREEGEGLRLTLASGAIAADMVILAVGVRPESGIAREAGLETNSRGGIRVDASMRTSDGDIYAVGDAAEVVDFVSGQPAMIPLAGPANKQGRIAADHICGIRSTYAGTQGSAILKIFDMTAASTGINEKTAKVLGLDYEKSFTHSGNHAGYYPGAKTMTIKMLFERTSGKILGCQIVGFAGVDKRCDVAAVAIRAGMTASDLAQLELCYAPPFSSARDPINMAGYVIENIMHGKSGIFHWHDVKDLQGREDVTRIDTRTEAEFRGGHIEGFINIPLDSLRERLHEIPTNKPVYVACQVGQRGYVAVRILCQNGYDAYNLSGGYRLYSAVMEDERMGSAVGEYMVLSG